MSTTKAEVRLDSFGIKSLLEAMVAEAKQEALGFTREVIQSLLRQPDATVDEVAREVTREVALRAAMFTMHMNLDGGSFTGVQADAATAMGWAQVANDLQFTAPSAVAALAAGNEPQLTI